MPIMGKPNLHVRFYYIEWRYFDRFVWNELYNTSLGGVNVHNVNDYIARNTYVSKYNRIIKKVAIEILMKKWNKMKKKKINETCRCY